MILHRKSSLKPAIILVADRTLCANYQTLFEGIFGTMQTTQVPRLMMRHFVAPPARTDRFGRAMASPLGLRRIEAALLAETSLTASDIVCATPESLPSLIGPWVNIILVSSSDPLGKGMSNTTSSAFCKGELYVKVWMQQMMDMLSKAKDKYDFSIIAGGAGAWQFARYPHLTEHWPVDTVYKGYFEGAGVALVRDILDGVSPPAFVEEKSTCIELIKPITGPAALGAVELSRGCGKGCKFCVASKTKMAHLPISTIITDLQTNVAGGQTSVVSTSEDMLRYGAAGSKVNFDALYNLFYAMRQVDGLRFMQVDHANISSVMQMDIGQLMEIRKLLTWQVKTEYLWVNLGIESANGQLVAQAGAGKIHPFDPDNWQQLIYDATDLLERAGFFPVYSIILGLPGETGDDVAKTQKLVNYLSTKRVVIFPIFHEPLDGKGVFNINTMRRDHFELFRSCYEINFKRVPKLYWDNQASAGVSWRKRIAVQMLGHVETFNWRKSFKTMAKSLPSENHLIP